MPRDIAVGIDLGTSNSVVSIYRRGVVETIPIGGKNFVPSVVSFRNGEVLVGAQAKVRLLAHPESTIGSVKRHMGDSAKRYEVGGRTYSPVDISSLVLKELVDGASRVLGVPVTQAVVTVPAYFTEEQKLDTKKAAEKIGLKVLRLLPEPTAAAISYGLDKGKDQVLMVYDLGGGTFDVSILEVKGNTFSVVAVDGDALLGGDDFDGCLVEHLAGIYKKQTGVDLAISGKKGGWFSKGEATKEKLLALQRLKETAEAAKIELSQFPSTEILIPDLMGRPLEATVTREELQRMTNPLLQRTLQKVRDALRSARMSPGDIDRVILVGGSTKMPIVRELVREEIKDPFTADQVDLIVSHGAAITADNIVNPRPKESAERPIEFHNVQAHSLGIDVLSEDRQIIFRPIIARNTQYPYRCGILGTTAQAYQVLVIMKVFRGESPDPAKNKCLGELTLPIKRPSSNIIPVAAVFELDADGILHFTAYEIAVNDQTLSFIKGTIEDGTNVIRDIDGLDKLVKRGYAWSVQVEIKGAGA